jgi:hypothetical protein
MRPESPLATFYNTEAIASSISPALSVEKNLAEHIIALNRRMIETNAQEITQCGQDASKLLRVIGDALRVVPTDVSMHMQLSVGYEACEVGGQLLESKLLLAGTRGGQEANERAHGVFIVWVPRESDYIGVENFGVALVRRHGSKPNFVAKSENDNELQNYTWDSVSSPENETEIADEFDDAFDAILAKKPVAELPLKRDAVKLLNKAGLVVVDQLKEYRSEKSFETIRGIGKVAAQRIEDALRAGDAESDPHR